MLFAAFFAEENPFLENRTVFKIVSRRRYDWCANARGNCQNLRKWVHRLCAPLRPFRSELKENFYHILLPHVLWMCTRTKMFRYIATGCHKNCQLTVAVVPKAHGRANVCAHRTSIKPCFYRGWFVVVHHLLTFSHCRPMAPLQSIKFQTADFPIFCARIIVIFWTTCRL